MRKQKMIKELPNSILFTLIYGEISNITYDVRIGVIDYNEELQNKVLVTLLDTIKREC